MPEKVAVTGGFGGLGRETGFVFGKKKSVH